MNYYRRYIGDFQADTMSLSMMEQGAYDRLLDFYYATENPIPLNTDRAAIICRAVTLEERAAVQLVLDTYFVRDVSGWRNTRADKEIAAAHTAKANGGKGGRPKKTETVTQTRTEAVTERLTGQASETEPERDILQPPTTNQEHTTTTSSAIADYSAGFVRFWDTWPKHPRKLRKFKCFTIWQKSKLEPIAETIVAHVASACDSQHWRDGFVPMPETYLNGRRWDDDLTPGAERMVI